MTGGGLLFGTLAVLGVALAAAFGSRGASAQPSLPSGSRAPHTKAVWVPVREDEIQRVIASACGCPSQGDLAVCVWNQLWPGVPYPPIDGDHPSVREAATVVDSVLAAITLDRFGFCGKRGDDEADDLPSIDDEPNDGTKPNDDAEPSDGKPSFDPNEYISDASKPLAGTFIQVRPNQVFLGGANLEDRALIWNILYNTTFEAALGKNLPESKARELAREVADNPQERLRYLHAIQCGEFNDQGFGTYKWKEGLSVPAKHGRAVVLLPIHDDVLWRIQSGQPVVRTVSLGKPSDAGKGGATGAGSKLPAFWAPALRTDALLDPKRARRVDTSGLVWSDGSPKTSPPPPIMKLGITDVPSGVSWGQCG